MDALKTEKGPLTPLPFICPCCSCKFSTSDEMIEHVKQSPIKIKTYSCSVCFLEFFTTAELKEHKEHDHRIFTSKYKCDECDAEYKTPVLLAAHKKKHDEIAQKLAAQGIHIPRPSANKSTEAACTHGVANPPTQNFIVEEKSELKDGSKAKPELKVKDGRKARLEEKDGDQEEKNCAQKVLPILNTVNSPPVPKDFKKLEKKQEPHPFASISKLSKKRGRKSQKRTKTIKGMEVKDMPPRKRRKQNKETGRRKKYRELITEDEEDKLEENFVEEKNTNAECTSEEKAVQDDEERDSDGLEALNKEIRCPECYVVFNSINGLTRHRKIHFKQCDALKCVLCPEHFKNSDSMNKHMQKCHPKSKRLSTDTDRKFPCWQPACKEVFTAQSLLSKHLAKVHGIKKNCNVVCPECSKSFPSKSTLTVHMRMHSGERPYKCDLCPKSFRVSSNLVCHRRIHTKEKPHTCCYCGRSFNFPNSLTRHLRTHTGEKPYVCEVCGDSFIVHTYLAKHAMLTGHGKLALEGPKFVCEICGKAFKTLTGYNNHQETHKVLRNPDGTPQYVPKQKFICETCGREFASNLTLKNHMVTHTDDRPFKCRFCEATFRYNKSRYCHEKSHAGKKDYMCTTCGKSFYQKGHLDKHMYTHLETRDWVCGYCGKSYTNKLSLRRHEIGHTKRKPFKCSLCPADFKTPTRLSMHLNNHRRKAGQLGSSLKSGAATKSTLMMYDGMYTINGADDSITALQSETIEYGDKRTGILVPEDLSVHSNNSTASVHRPLMFNHVPQSMVRSGQMLEENLYAQRIQAKYAY